MAGYMESTLIKDEKIIARANVSLCSMGGKIALGILLAPVVIGLFLLLFVCLHYISTELAFTNKRVIAKVGFIRRRTIELNINKIESIPVGQGVFGRIFNFGTLCIAGAGNPQAPIPGISDPMRFHRAFMQHQDQADA